MTRRWRSDRRRAGSSTSRPGWPCRRCAASRAPRSSRRCGRWMPNLRPEGKQGALVRTLDSHLSYYDRWAKSWEFQALLKARPIAGDAELGAAYVERRAAEDLDERGARELRRQRAAHARAGHRAHPLRRTSRTSSSSAPAASATSSSPCSCCSSCTASPTTGIRQRGTLDALDALVERGVHRPHRCRHLRPRLPRCCGCSSTACSCTALSRTHLMPRTPEGLRVLAQGVGHRRIGPAGLGALGERQARGARHPRAALLSTAALRRRLAARGGALPLDRAGARPARGDRLPRSRRCPPPHRGAHERAEPQVRRSSGT